jgi:hypothetical protein
MGQTIKQITMICFFTLLCCTIVSNGNVKAATAPDGISPVVKGPVMPEEPAFSFMDATGDVCDGTNYSNNNYQVFGTWYATVLAMTWYPASNNTITGIEVFTGGITSSIRVALWSSVGGNPGSVLGISDYFTATPSYTWQGADLNTSVQLPLVRCIL